MTEVLTRFSLRWKTRDLSIEKMKIDQLLLMKLQTERLKSKIFMTKLILSTMVTVILRVLQ